MAEHSKISKVRKKNKENFFISNCEVANTSWKRCKGLLGHKELKNDEALWIYPCTSIHTFFMGFSIDAAFLDKKGKIVALYEKMPPWRLSFIHFTAHGVLEMAPGTIARNALKKGEEIEICHFS